MDLKKVKDQTLEGIVLQGRSEEIQRKQSELNERLSEQNKELSRLEGVQKQKAITQKELSDLKEEAKDVGDKLAQCVNALKEEGVSIPFGKVETGGTVVRM